MASFTFSLSLSFSVKPILGWPLDNFATVLTIYRIFISCQPTIIHRMKTLSYRWEVQCAGTRINMRQPSKRLQSHCQCTFHRRRCSGICQLLYTLWFPSCLLFVWQAHLLIGKFSKVNCISLGWVANRSTNQLY